MRLPGAAATSYHEAMTVLFGRRRRRGRSVVPNARPTPLNLLASLLLVACVGTPAAFAADPDAPSVLAPDDSLDALAEPQSLPFPKLPTQGSLQTDVLFPRYQRLMPAVSFWTRVFSHYSELQSVVHSAAYPEITLQVLDFRAEATRMSEDRLARYRRDRESDARDAMETLIKRIHAKRHAPQTMTAEEQRVFRLFEGIDDDDRFKRMRGTIRTQRGLKERTETALQVSDAYLPYMEQIFSGYDLPKQLTRLPLVESSFDLQAYSKAGAAGIWQFIPSSARVYMRLNEVVDDRRDPWTSTDAAARHLRDDYDMLQDWPLAITAYNHGRYGIARGLEKVKGKSLIDLIDRYDSKRFGFAGKNYYAEFLAAVDIERRWREMKERPEGLEPLEFEVVETKHYVPYETLRRLCGADDELFRRLNPAYKPEVIEGKLYVPPGHLIRVPAGSSRAFEVGYAKLGDHELFNRQRVYFLLHRVRRGDTLSEIAHRYGTSISTIKRANGLRSSRIRIGQVLKVPPHRESRPGPITVAIGESKPSLTREQRKALELERGSDRVHLVRSGDTLSEIAQRYHVSVSALRNANGLRSSSIRVGQSLTIPGAAGDLAAASPRSHEVRRGQTLISISKRYGVSVDALKRANGLTSSTIRAGDTLRVPGSGDRVHIVRSGQTLSEIAHEYGVSVDALRQANGLGRSSLIKVGQRLQVP